jgi:hypothetical protein
MLCEVYVNVPAGVSANERAAEVAVEKLESPE